MRRAIVLTVALIACAARQPVAPVVRDLDRMMSSPAAREVARDAPDAFAEASAAVGRARDAREGDGRVDALALTARLAFERAQSLAGLAAARRRIVAAERQRSEIDADVARIEQEAQEMQSGVARTRDARRAAARARQVASAPAQVAAPERQAAAAELRQQASLFVAAAVMLGADAPRVLEARQRIASAERAAGVPDATAALLAAGAAYATAEGLVQAARGVAGAEGATDGATLEAALSDAGGFDPRRDVRGVIAVMRGLFDGPRLGATSRQRVETLARVIRSHADARVRVEVFVGGAARGAAEALATAQAEALAAALRREGVATDRLQAQGLYRAASVGLRDDRVEVVLVVPTNP
jgi:hypothetical protein